ncbi:2OG-Fe dioxygenase family protein [Gallaecimonas sp. GXIMD1310]|uniref:2OG-Fe dioxygenase family protein n=1 Tax=Gallaecimonas sp. GXIMD1310 TaxID=3131926 RepID=UPI00325396D6
MTNLSTASDFTYQLGQLPSAAVTAMTPSFAALPKDPYIQGDFRYRCYSNVKVSNGQVQRQATKSFMQSSDINKYLGDVERVYEEIPDSTLHSPLMVDMLADFKQRCALDDQSVIEIHQMRIKGRRDDNTPPAPEGVHQDGFDYLGIYVMGSHHIDGGEVMLYNGPQQAPFFCERFNDGQYVVLNDRRYFHNAAPITPIAGHDEGYWDVIVFTAHAN